MVKGVVGTGVRDTQKTVSGRSELSIDVIFAWFGDIDSFILAQAILGLWKTNPI